MAWPEGSEAYLVAQYGKLYASAIARRLGVSEGAVRSKAFRMGLAFRPDPDEPALPEHIRGVSRNGLRWQARFRGKHVGLHPTWREAALAYNEAARSALGDKARLNRLD